MCDDKSKDATRSHLKFISLNVEGLERNLYNLEHFIVKDKPDLVFLSEPQIFSCDISSVMGPFNGNYKFSMNSEDSHDPDLPLDRFKAKGGTLAMWSAKLDQFITVLPSNSPSVLPLLIHKLVTLVSTYQQLVLKSNLLMLYQNLTQLFHLCWKSL